MQNNLTSFTNEIETRSTESSECELLQAYMWAHIPLATAMQVRVTSADEQTGLRLHAPLVANINDKGTAFGGSISALLTLAGWGWLWLAHRREGVDKDVVIHGSKIKYKQPLSGDLVVVCPPANNQAWQEYLRTLYKRGRARLSLHPNLLQMDRTVAAKMQAEYVAL